MNRRQKKRTLCRIVLTGAPSSGKSSAMEELRQQNFENIILVPESAAVLLQGGFPAPDHDELEQIRLFQRTILALQENLELVFECKSPHAWYMVLDRSKLDGAAFWPLGPEDYWRTFEVDLKKEMARVDYVLFLELPEPEQFGGVHRSRFHNYHQSLESEKALKKIWSNHHQFKIIHAEINFLKKIETVTIAIKNIIKNHNC